MPSPFPGMDPYLEAPEVWPDFHSRFINGISEKIVPLVRPRYSVRIEERVYLGFVPTDELELIRPDITITKRAQDLPRSSSATTVAAVPVPVAMVMPEEVREVYLVVQSLELDRVVTVIELLSPSNKRSGSPGRMAYLEKRGAVLKSPAHLVEIDLLRGGQRMPMRGPLPPADYYVILSRREKRPQCDVYPCSLRATLPEVPVPLAGGDPDIPLNLQSVLSTVYDRAGYDYSLNYTRGLEPSFGPNDQEWATLQLKAR